MHQDQARDRSALLSSAAAVGCALATLIGTLAVFASGTRSMLLAVVRAAADGLV